MRILFVASECFPLIKTGGLADVVGALPIALVAAGSEVKVFLPGFPDVLKGLNGASEIGVIRDLAGKPARLLAGKASSGIHVIALDAPHLFGFEGNPYLDEAGKDRPNGLRRYAAFCRVATGFAMGRYGNWQADILHAHDWQAGLALAYARQEGSRAPKTVMTIHNLAFQGLFDGEDWPETGLPEDLFDVDGLEYWGKISLMKAGLVFADGITTVSPTYALEIQTEANGMGFDGLLRSRSERLYGILNGIDTTIWDPASDTALVRGFGPGQLAGKRACKAALQKEFGLPVKARTPLFTVISRLTTQKGLDMLARLAPVFRDTGAQLAILGSGEKAIEAAFIMEAKQFPKNIAVRIGYDEPLAHRIQAGGDIMLVPSRFEPCGLTQLCALRYGSIPLVSRVGGLADTVIGASPMALDSGVATGIQFYPAEIPGLEASIRQAISLYRDRKTWNRMIRNAMNQDVSWKKPAESYLDLYRSLEAS